LQGSGRGLIELLCQHLPRETVEINEHLSQDIQCPG
jgi:hypothetical protein